MEEKNQALCPCQDVTSSLTQLRRLWHPHPGSSRSFTLWHLKTHSLAPLRSQVDRGPNGTPPGAAEVQIDKLMVFGKGPVPKRVRLTPNGAVFEPDDEGEAVAGFGVCCVGKNCFPLDVPEKSLKPIH